MCIFYFLLLFWVGAYCGIYKSSYNVSNKSYLNSPLLPFSFISPFPHSWNSFNRYHFSIYIHVYTVFAPYSPFHTLSLPPPSSRWYRTCSDLLFSDFCICIFQGRYKKGLRVYKMMLNIIKKMQIKDHRIPFHTH
jgi:hypothetical protein